MNSWLDVLLFALDFFDVCLDFFSVAIPVGSGVGSDVPGVIALVFLSSLLFLTLSRAMRFC